MKATVLIDNIGKGELGGEWGLAVYIEHEGHRILLDTGASGKFVKNAAAMGIDLSRVEYGVLSHAHFDHSDGMAAFFKSNASAPFYLREGAGENCYGRKWIFHKYIGIRKGYLSAYRERIRFADGDTALYDGAYLIAHKTAGLDKIGKKAGMAVRRGGHLVPDDFAHEQSLVLDTEKGLVIFNSCSHGGAENIIREVRDTFAGKKVYALVGGMHLFATPDDEVRAIACRIKETGVERVVTGHCTGERAFKILREELGEAAEQMLCGYELSI